MSDQPAAARFVLGSSPHVGAPEDVPLVMRRVAYALLPAVLFSLYVFRANAGSVAAVYLLSVAGCLAFEYLIQRFLLRVRPTLSDGSALVTGLLLAMNLPPQTPWWMALIGAGVAIGIGKQAYGGLGHNLFNPALVARVVLLVSFPVQMTAWVGVDGVTGATPLGLYKLKELATSGGIPNGLGEMFLGLSSGSLGETSELFLLAGGLYLLWRRIIGWQIPAAFIGTVVLGGAAFWLADPVRFLHPLAHLVSGGLFLGAFFMATDMVTSPVTRTGQLLFGFGCGLITLLIRLFGAYPEGVSFAILIMNAAVPLIDRSLTPRPFGRERPAASGKG